MREHQNHEKVILIKNVTYAFFASIGSNNGRNMSKILNELWVKLKKQNLKAFNKV